MGLIGRPVDSLIPPVGTTSGGVHTTQDTERRSVHGPKPILAISRLSLQSVNGTQEGREREKK